jgi:general stress protein 26
VIATTLIDYERLAEEAWTRLRDAGDERNHPMRLVVLATVDGDGTPDARTMVLRGADRRSGRIWLYTDRRSEKVDQIAGCRWACVVAWDRTAGIQLRLRGAAEVHESGPVADRHWRQASLSLQALFASPDAPGRPLRQPDPRLVGMKRALDEGCLGDARSNFAVIEVTLRAIEWHQVVEGDQRRAVMHSATGWAVQPLSP